MRRITSMPLKLGFGLALGDYTVPSAYSSDCPIVTVPRIPCFQPELRVNEEHRFHGMAVIQMHVVEYRLPSPHSAHFLYIIVGFFIMQIGGFRFFRPGIPFLPACHEQHPIIFRTRGNDQRHSRDRTNPIVGPKRRRDHLGAGAKPSAVLPDRRLCLPPRQPESPHTREPLNGKGPVGRQSTAKEETDWIDR